MFELTTLVVIGTGCICRCKSNYRTITTTTAPVDNEYIFIAYMYLEQLTHVTWHSSWCIMLFRPVYAKSWSLEGREFLISAVFSWAELVEFEIMSLLKEFNVNFLDKLRVFVLGSYYYRSWIISRQLILQYAIHWYVIILHRNQWWGTHFTQESMMRYIFYTIIGAAPF